MSAPNFSERCCVLNQIPIEKFSETLLLEACYPRARSLYSLWLKLGNSNISNELDFLMTLGQSAKLDEIEGMVNGVYFTSYLRELTKIRRRFDLRISGSRLVKIAKKCFENQEPDTPSSEQ
jgi:hypothetical protein